MALVAQAVATDHVTPHDLVTYSRCPFEMELLHARHASIVSGQPVAARTPIGTLPLRHSPLFTPPNLGVVVNDGRLDIFPDDLLVYEDAGEDDLPMLFSEGRIRLDPRFAHPNATLIDRAFRLSGRPDLVIARGAGDLVPVEYKSTHLFVGYHESHGRMFDVIQAIAECRLVHAAFGRRPPYGLVLYGDVANDGEHEGWVQVPYGDAEERWLRVAIDQVLSDPVRAPVPSERTCTSCQPNRDGQCRYAAVPPGNEHHTARSVFVPAAHWTGR